MKPIYKVGDIVEYDGKIHYPKGKGAIGIVTGWGCPARCTSEKEGPIISWVYSPDPSFFTEYNHVPFFHRFIKKFTGEVPDAAVQDKS